MTDATRPDDAEPGDFAAMIPAVRVPATLTFAGLVGGFAVGLILAGQPGLSGVATGVEALGGLWLRGLQMTIIPLVASLIVLGAAHRTHPMCSAWGSGQRAVGRYAWSHREGPRGLGVAL